MTTFDLDAACAAALQRLRESLNRSAAQHRSHLSRLAAEMLLRRVFGSAERA